MYVTKGYEPAKVFQYFEELCRIPHGSDNTDAISNYIRDFALERGLIVNQDSYGNLLIIKEASAGYEDLDTVMIQGHMDMVCEKNAECKHNFLKDPLNLCIIDDYLFAKGTTLGGDDGIAIAYAMAILDDNSIKHPRLEIVITVGEEVGMTGCSNMDFSKCQAKMLINIDAEEEGVFLTSCAGGLRGVCSVPVRYKEKSGEKYDLVVCGLKGGHSGTEIDRYRGNSNIIMGRLLHYMGTKLHFDIVSLQGGLQDNAIPREANAEILVQNEDMDDFENIIHSFERTIQNEYRASEDNISIYCENRGTCKELALTDKTQERVIFLLNTIPDGVQKMSMETPGLVQTSLNIGIMRLHENTFTLTSALRSSVDSEKMALSDKLRYLTETIGGIYEEKYIYPAWEYRENSRLRDVMCAQYQALFGRKPLLKGIHAGLECGIIYDKVPGIDIIACGPDIFDIHTPKEKLSISSTQRMYRFLLEVLENMKQ